MNCNIFNRKVIASFAIAKFPAIFKLNKRIESNADALKVRSLDDLTHCAGQGMTIIKKQQSGVIQSGRSMIEMLGVLAIIGVLSIGGLAGYSKAVDKYRVNETINQVTFIVQNTRDLFRTQPNYYGSMSFDTSLYMSNINNVNRILADKAKLFPDSLIKNNYKNLWDGEIKFYTDGRFSDDDGKAVIMDFNMIPQEACIEIATKDWQNSLGVVAILIRGSTTNYGLQNTFANACTTQYANGSALICAQDMPVTVEQATSACNIDKGNRVSWKFY